jgi:O-antigen/teichoic acid export membrane protein
MIPSGTLSSVNPPSELRARSFFVRYLTLSGGETFSKLCAMAAFAYLARVLGPSQYGIVEQALAITMFFVLGVESGMGLYGARVVAADPGRVAQLVPQVMLLRAALGVPAFVVIISLAAHYQLAGLGILAINGIAVLVTPFLTQWVFQGLRQMHWVAGGAAARNFTFVALVFVLVRPGSDVRLVAVAEVCSILVLALVNAYFLHGWLRVRLDVAEIAAGTRRLFGDVWFMGLSDLMWACLWYAPSLAVGWVGTGNTQQVAWLAAALRLVLAVHVFVFLYFFNLLPNLAEELVVGLDGWRDLMKRSIATALWPACLIAIGGTLFAPVLIPAVYGVSYEAAVLPFQIAIWMIPLAWFNGHFRFSLVAAGQQWSEFLVAVATAAVTVGAALFLSHQYGADGAAGALLLGGAVNTLLAGMASSRGIGPMPILATARPVLLATVASLLLGVGMSAAAGVWFGTARQDNELVRGVSRWIGNRR